EKESFGLNLIENRTLSFFEPEWNIQLGMPQLPWVKLDLVSSYAGPSFQNILRLGRVRGYNVSIGLTVDISKMNKKSQ
ncbi:MAG: hypothetical protein ABI123_04990, partial [Ginsengibacter sp.]